MPKSPYSTKLIRSYDELQKLKKINEARKQGKLPPASCIDLTEGDVQSSDDEDNDVQDAADSKVCKERTISASPSPPKASSSRSAMSSAESTPTKPKMRFGKVCKDWTAEENESIVDYLSETYNRPVLTKALQRPSSSVAVQVERILRLGLAEANRKIRQS